MPNLFSLQSKLLLIFAVFSLSALAQTKDELAMLQNHSFEQEIYQPRKIKFNLIGNNAITKYNPLSLTFSSLLFVYQSVFSVQISSKCSYEISCSNFSKECLKRYGLLKGIALSADRLTRCSPWSAPDVHYLDLDMVKQKIKDSPEKYQLRN